MREGSKKTVESNGKRIMRKTRSVCPVCGRNLPALLQEQPDGSIHLIKECPEHGAFSVPVWHGAVDFAAWTAGAESMQENEGMQCPSACGLCNAHQQDSCCVLLEVTNRCNLHCRYCFAHGGESTAADPAKEPLSTAIDDITHRCGRPTLQLSGGEPTMRQDLPALIAHAKKRGCAYVQLNTNGIRLAEDPAFAEQLADAGLDYVFLQFDGVHDSIYQSLRGDLLLEYKQRCIDHCGHAGLGVTLVPTIVPGVNDREIGALTAFAVKHIPVVRGIHFQPISYFGRHPGRVGDEEYPRYTLDQLIRDIHQQAGIPLDAFVPSRCDHPLCGFHASFMEGGEGHLLPVTKRSASPSSCRTTAAQNREFIGSRWSLPHDNIGSASPLTEPSHMGKTSAQPCVDVMDLDEFVWRMRHRSFTLTAMAFQDAMNLNIERLRRCSLHVYDRGKIMPFCAKYL